MRKIILFLMIALVSLYAASAQCADQKACKNQDGENLCSPADSSCSYTVFTGTIICAPDSSVVDSDADGDLWSNNCDALPSDVLEWFDMDGDGYGHNYDCDDFNKTIGENCDPDGDGKTNEEEHNDGTDPNVNDHGRSGGGGSSSTNLINVCTGQFKCSDWSICVDGAKTRVCTSTNGCENNKPDEWEGCPNYVILKVNEEANNKPTVIVPEVQIIETVPQVPTIEEEKNNRVTGQVFNTEPGSFKPATMWLLLMLILAVVGFYAYKKVKN